jgi:hypothetical protein
MCSRILGALKVRRQQQQQHQYVSDEEQPFSMKMDLPGRHIQHHITSRARPVQIME